jgi:two-component system chemotaxis sensor kinase CheA
VPDNSIEGVVETLAAALLQADPNDPAGLAELHTDFEEIGTWAAQESSGQVSRACTAAAGVLEEVILEEASDPTASLRVVDQTLAALREVVCERRPPEEVVFPVELGLDEGPAATPAVHAGEGPSAGPVAEVLECLDGVGHRADEPIREDASGETPIAGDPELLQDFVSEARDHLHAVDLHLLDLETEPNNPAAVNAVFRAFHTIKGVAGFLELSQIKTLAHEIETLLDKARKQELTLDGNVVDLLFVAKDLMVRLIDGLAGAMASGQVAPQVSGLVELLERIRAAAAGNVGKDAPSLGIEAGETGARVGDILVDAGVVTAHELQEVVRRQRESEPRKKLGELLVESGRASAREVAAALRSQKAASAEPAAVPREAVKIDAGRLDQLVDMIGELVIAETMVSQAPELKQIQSEHLTRLLVRLDKISRELQEMTTALRMVPLRPVFQRMARLTRDVAKKTGKRVDFVAFGQDTEIDRNLVEKISDPLAHMVRNAVDHGLEATGEERKAAGKPEHGRVELRAFHRGGNVYIEVADDGRGLDREAIVAQGRERGLVGSDDILTDQEVYRLLFEPGFSTAETVTDLSGRGVGMDVVRSNIEELRGRIEIQSTAGAGSVFTICLPLTLALMEGLVLRLGAQRYILPTLSIARMLRPLQTDLQTVFERGEVISVGDDLIPLCRLDRLFHVREAEQDPAQATVVVVESGGQSAAILVDELLGQQQIIIKSLGESLQDIPGIAGGAVMPDGRVGLVLDPGSLVMLTQDCEEEATRQRLVS